MAGALGLLLAATMAAAPAAHIRPVLDVVVVIENDVAVSDADFEVIADGVRTIWRPAADIRLRQNGGRSWGGASAAPVETVMGSDRIQLVLTGRVRRSSGPALGWVDFVKGMPQPVITVSMTEITAMMHAGRWQSRALDTLPGAIRQRFTRRALTLSVAHEIGHYLLRSTAHSKHGLMQANFGVDDIMDTSPSVARLTADEISQVRLPRAPLSARQSN